MEPCRSHCISYFWYCSCHVSRFAVIDGSIGNHADRVLDYGHGCVTYHPCVPAPESDRIYGSVWPSGQQQLVYGVAAGCCYGDHRYCECYVSGYRSWNDRSTDRFSYDFVRQQPAVAGKHVMVLVKRTGRSLQ